MRRFDSDPRLQFFPFSDPHKQRVFLLVAEDVSVLSFPAFQRIEVPLKQTNFGDEFVMSSVRTLPYELIAEI
jgi:hypothetical protein